MKVKVYAKVNLSLNVVGVEDGYHLLDALTTSIDIFDVVQVCLRNDGQVTVSGVDIPQEQNVAYRVAKAFFAAFGGNGCDVAIHKNIPFSQGLGGSSADASAVVYCLCKLMGFSLDDARIKCVCDSVGSDVWFMLHGGCGVICGRSQFVSCDVVDVYGCLTTFDHKSDTATVFKQYNLTNNCCMVDNTVLLSALNKGDIKCANNLCFNALQQPNRELCQYADDFINYCQTFGIKPTMTGSGSAYFVLCQSKCEAEDLAQKMQEKGFNSVVFKTMPTGIEEV